jgi:hypothetical protein
MIEKLGNSRLIYKQVKIENLDLSESLSSINQFIELNPKLMRSNSSEYIYFFSKGSDLNISNGHVWVAVEVIGFCSSDGLDDFELGTKDLDSSEVHNFNGPSNLEISSFLEHESSIRTNNSFVDSWRVKINFNSGIGTVLQFWE